MPARNSLVASGSIKIASKGKRRQPRVMIRKKCFRNDVHKITLKLDTKVQTKALVELRDVFDALCIDVLDGVNPTAFGGDVCKVTESTSKPKRAKKKAKASAQAAQPILTIRNTQTIAREVNPKKTQESLDIQDMLPDQEP